MTFTGEEIREGKLLARVFYDEDTFSPRKDRDNAGTMVCWHNHYDLGDEQPSCDPGEFLEGLLEEVDAARMGELHDQWEAESDALPPLYEDGEFQPHHLAAREAVDRAHAVRVREALEAAGVVVLPLYLYDHSGITMSTSPFSCRWDSGQVGYIYATPEVIEAEWKGDKDAARRCLEAEVEEYAAYLRGEVYYIEVMRLENEDDDDGLVIDGCGGFIGSEYALQSAREMLDEAARP